MESTQLQVGHRYRLKSGESVTLMKIFGRGLNRQVRVDPKPTGWTWTSLKIKRFAAQVTHDLGSAMKPAS